MIRATGMIGNTRVTVEIHMKNGKPTIDKDPYLQQRLDFLLGTVPLGGSYFPDKDTMESALAAMNYFFDTRPDIEVIDENLQVLPYVDGVVY